MEQWEGRKLGEMPEFKPEGEARGEVIPHEPPATERSVARRIALQVLYEVDSAHHDAGSVTAVHLQARQVSRKSARYVQRIVTGVTGEQAALDELIRQFAPEFPVDQLALVDRNILRIALYELTVETHIPIGVLIDEAVQLANLFGAEGAVSFVNGVLGALVSDAALMQRLRPRGDSDDEPDADDADDDDEDDDSDDEEIEE